MSYSKKKFFGVVLDLIKYPLKLHAFLMKKMVFGTNGSKEEKIVTYPTIYLPEIRIVLTDLFRYCRGVPDASWTGTTTERRRPSTSRSSSDAFTMCLPSHLLLIVNRDHRARLTSLFAQLFVLI
jgi:hypothetical protein